MPEQVNETEGIAITQTQLRLMVNGGYDTVAAMQAAHPTGTEGEAYTVGGNIYTWNTDAGVWQNIGSFQGPQGAKGNAASIAIGTVTTGEPGTNATVTNVGTTAAAVLNIAIPRGATGLQGAQGPQGNGIELIVVQGILKWRVVGETDWIELCSVYPPSGIAGQILMSDGNGSLVWAWPGDCQIKGAS